MSTKPLPLIPRKYFKRDGKVDMWDVIIDGGPVKVEFTAILAREALQRDPDRFKFELPRGVQPGPLQVEAEERARAQSDERDTEAPDPVYGRRKQE